MLKTALFVQCRKNPEPLKFKLFVINPYFIALEVNCFPAWSITDTEMSSAQYCWADRAADTYILRTINQNNFRWMKR